MGFCASHRRAHYVLLGPVERSPSRPHHDRRHAWMVGKTQHPIAPILPLADRI
jgi:hypothetical protein